MRRGCITLVLAVAGCGGDHDVERYAITLPPASEAFVLGAAGAPQPLFGPDTEPTFDSAFAALAADGFNRFLPIFLTNEDGSGTSHYTYFLPHAAFPEAVFGPVSPALTCGSSRNPWAAADGQMQIVLPAYLLMMDYPFDTALDPDVLRTRYAAFLADCLGGDASQVPALYLHDEPANGFMSTTYNTPATPFVLANVGVLADIGAEVLAAPAMVVEAPVPYFLPMVAEPWGIPPGDVDGLITTFWNGADATAPVADIYGFDVYPVDMVSDFAPIAEYIAIGKSVAPQADPIAVLQGFGFADMGLDVGTPGRKPTRDETRAMAFIAAAEGVSGIWWYGQSALNLGDPVWEDVREVARDLRRISGIFALSPVAMDLGVPGVSMRATRDATVTYVIIANQRDVPAQLDLPISPNAVRVVDVLNEIVVATDTTDSLRLTLAGHESRVLAVMDE